MKKQTLRIALLVTALFAGAIGSVNAQSNEAGQTGRNYISTGMPILLIAPDARAGGMGDVGAATTPDAYSAHWNNAKYAFIDNVLGISTTYTPWLRNLGVGDMNLLYLGGYYKLSDMGTLAASLTYFSLGEIQSTDEFGNSLGDMRPNEFAVDLTYAMKISDNFGIGATGRLNHSDLTNGQDVDNTTTKAANSIAADIGIYYQKPLEKNSQIAFGLVASNLGAKLSYSDDDTKKEFLPSNLRLGGRYTKDIDQYNQINVMLDINKLLVPTPPLQEDGESKGDYQRRYTEYTQMGAIQGVMQSFSDAPGGFSEELQELQLSGGLEYWYSQMFAGRLGYFYEHNNKGGRQYFTVGAGIRYSYFNFDLSYLVPTSKFSTNPLSNTVRISLTIALSKEK